MTRRTWPTVEEFAIAVTAEVPLPWRRPVAPETVSVGVVRAPVLEIEVVPVCPNAAVFAEKFVVDAFEMLN